ncbi:hypothetical protein SmJEL517_g03691 [Synchytrium microbalum]|uniref:poly(ADP-ribose) glycohydrolase n=1 Tax=Synchytrium microbalum TaxID=1806994 RepID=A0A507C1T4_9FUNG|nr:uncharacterized protein SmJEL517_g03691 [Synchytrium microbalum]TPX33328.1 hypothetical protein SmJEL517_g03691 [Synchytrium microbalum]
MSTSKWKQTTLSFGPAPPQKLDLKPTNSGEQESSPCRKRKAEDDNEGNPADTMSSPKRHIFQEEAPRVDVEGVTSTNVEPQPSNDVQDVDHNVTLQNEAQPSSNVHDKDADIVEQNDLVEQTDFEQNDTQPGVQEDDAVSLPDTTPDEDSLVYRDGRLYNRAGELVRNSSVDQDVGEHQTSDVTDHHPETTIADHMSDDPDDTVDPDQDDRMEINGLLHTILLEFADDSTAAVEDRWDRDHVRLPNSPCNTYIPQSFSPPIPKWALIEDTLRKFINDSLSGPLQSAAAIEEAILSYNQNYRRTWRFGGLSHYLDVVSSRPRANFRRIIPGIARLALDLPKLIRQPIPLLKQGMNIAVTLSQMQVASLLANAFFCTFPCRSEQRNGSEYYGYPSINFNDFFRLQTGRSARPQQAKFEGILNYFERVLQDRPSGSITFQRRAIPSSEMPIWKETAIPLRGLTVSPDGRIEDDGEGMLQMDFANKSIGGGVLGHGAVQEEIRFIISTELILSRLLAPVLENNETLFVMGSERFSSYIGYAETFRWEDNFVDSTARDGLGRRRTEIVAVDAIDFSRKPAYDQFRERYILRELNKAYAGFLPSTLTCLDENAPIATGNWGCGAFKGDLELKAVIQMMAASIVGRDLVYFTFADRRLPEESFVNMHSLLRQRGVSVGQLYQATIAYHNERENRSLFQYLIEKFN